MESTDLLVAEVMILLMSLLIIGVDLKSGFSHIGSSMKSWSLKYHKLHLGPSTHDEIRIILRILVSNNLNLILKSCLPLQHTDELSR